MSLIDLCMRKLPFSFVKYLANLSWLTSETIFSGYNPCLAFSTDSVSMSVANICIVKFCFIFSMCSWNIIASEYASSPVEHPATQTRIGDDGSLSLNNSGIIFSLNDSNAGLSRKKFVTFISSSLNSVSISTEFCFRKR